MEEERDSYRIMDQLVLGLFGFGGLFLLTGAMFLVLGAQMTGKDKLSSKRKPAVEESAQNDGPRTERKAPKASSNATQEVGGAVAVCGGVMLVLAVAMKLGLQRVIEERYGEVLDAIEEARGAGK